MSDDETTHLCTRCGSHDRHTWVEGDCVLPHRGHSTKLIEGGHVCRGCVDRHRDWLEEIVLLYGTLAEVVLAGSVPDDDAGEYQKPRKAPASPSPLRLAAWALLHGKLNDHTVDEDGGEHAAYLGASLPNIPAVLAGWAQAVFDAQGWTATAPDTVTGAVAALIADRDVMARTPDVDTYDAELRWVYRALRSAHGLSSKGKTPVGRCPSQDGWGKECGGPLWQDKGGAMAVDCGKCGRHFDERFLSHLGGMIAS